MAENQPSSTSVKRAVNAGCLAALVLLGLAVAFWKQISDLDWYWQLALLVLAFATIRLAHSIAGSGLQELQIAYPQALFKAKNFQEALKQVDEVLAQNPTNAEAYYLKGQCHDTLRQTAQANAAWLKAIDINPSQRGALHDLACNYMDAGDYLAAAEFFGRAREAGAMFLEMSTFERNIEVMKKVLTDRGLRADRVNDFKAALEYTNALIKLDPDYARAYAWRAQHHVNLGNYRQALEDGRKCRELEPAYSKVEIVMRLAEEALNRELAREQLERRPTTIAAGALPVPNRRDRSVTNIVTPKRTGREAVTLRKPKDPAKPPPGAESGSKEWEVGYSLFGYIEIRQDIHSGGMGTVYYAWNHLSDSPVALKTVQLWSRESHVTKREQLRDEAYRWFKLGEHPCIIRLYVVYKVDYRHLVLSMEYVAGESGVGPTLADHLRAKGRLDVERATRIACDVCEAMEFAHTRQRIIHRDLKPSNVFITSTGRAKVGDFGLASEDGTTMGDFVGTPQYAAPEQWDATSLVTPAIDVYSIGVMLFEMLSGRRPIALGDEYDHAVQDVRLAMLGRLHKEQVPPLMASVCPNQPPRLASLVDRCLAKDPRKRPATYRELRQQLLAFARSADRAAIVPVVPAPQMEGETAFYNGISEDAMDHSEAAREHYLQAIRHEPFRSQNSQAWANLAKVFGQLYRFDDSIRAARHALDIDSNDSIALHALAMSLSAKGSPADGLKVFDRLIEKHADRADAYVGKGLALLNVSRIDAAQACFARAIDLQPDLYHAWNGLAMCTVENAAVENAVDTAELQEALALLDHCLELEPTCADAHNNRSRVLMMLERPQEALMAIQDAVRHDPRHPGYHMNLGIGLGNLRRFEEAVAPLKRAIELDANNAMAHLILARVFGELKQYAKANELGLRAAQLGQPDGADVARRARECMS